VTPTIVSSGNGRGALPTGIRVLAKGGTALDAVEACARIVEADPSDDTVGYGGLPNVLGVVELDASIIDGTTHAAGSVAALTGFTHPITVARAVMDRLPHVMLVGAGAARFAREIGAEEGDLLTPGSRERWIARLRDAKHTPASIATVEVLAPVVAEMVQERGTVNFIANRQAREHRLGRHDERVGIQVPGPRRGFADHRRGPLFGHAIRRRGVHRVR
jgi:isoaspartyl peptidase/L-asparaginase-like protein (Ntn-hydrolase superfamily)